MLAASRCFTELWRQPASAPSSSLAAVVLPSVCSPSVAFEHEHEHEYEHDRVSLTHKKIFTRIQDFVGTLVVQRTA